MRKMLLILLFLVLSFQRLAHADFFVCQQQCSTLQPTHYEECLEVCKSEQEKKVDAACFTECREDGKSYPYCVEFCSF